MSLHPTESLIQSEGVQDIDSLIRLLKQFKTRGCNHIDVAVQSDGQFIAFSDAVVSVELLERTLSDNSVAHDILLKFEEC